MIGEALSPYDDGVVVATKAGMLRTGPGGWSPHGHPRYLKQQAYASRLRLGVDRIPLFYLHRIDPAYGLAEQLGALVELREEGVIDGIGLSAVTAAQLNAAREITPIAAVQNHYNLVSRDSDDVLALAESAGIPFIAFWSLGHGRELLANADLLSLAASAGHTPAQCIAWLLHRSDSLIALPGTSSIAGFARMRMPPQCGSAPKRSPHSRASPRPARRYRHSRPAADPTPSPRPHHPDPQTPTTETKDHDMNKKRDHGAGRHPTGHRPGRLRNAGIRCGRRRRGSLHLLERFGAGVLRHRLVQEPRQLQRRAADSRPARLAGRGRHYLPALAASWETSDDGLVWTFTLRDDVTFHDGEKLSADAVQASLERFTVDGSTLSAPRWYGSSRVVDPLTWELTLAQPTANVLQQLSNPDIPILSAGSIEKFDDGDRCADPTTIVGTGPFVATSYQKGASVTLSRNDDYEWGPDFAAHSGPANLAEVEIRFVPEASARIGALTSGQADAAASIPPLNAEQVEESGDFALSSAPATGVPFVAPLNTTAGPTADIRVRQALRAAVDIDGIIDTIYKGRYDRAWTPLAPTTAPSGLLRR